MKTKRFYLFLCLFLSLNVSLNCQIELREWIYEINGIGWSQLRNVKITGDTSINSVDFKIVDPPFYSPYYGTVPYVNFEDGHGFIFSSTFQDTFKLYDFNLQQGDTLKIRAMSEYDQTEFFVQYLINSVDTILMSNTSYKRQGLVAVGNNFVPLSFGEYLIENIGSISNFIPYSDLIDASPTLCGFINQQSDTISLANSACQNIISDIELIKPKLKNKFNVFPNPFDEYLIVNSKNNIPSASLSLSIVDLTGNIILNSPLSLSKRTVLNELEKGLYLLLISDARTGETIETHRVVK